MASLQLKAGKRPLEGLGSFIALCDPCLDGSHKFGDALEDTAPDALASDFREQPLDEIEPGRRSWREMQLETLMFGKPSLHLLGLVGPVVVTDGMDVEVFGHLPIDFLEKAQELLGTMARQALSDNLAG